MPKVAKHSSVAKKKRSHPRTQLLYTAFFQLARRKLHNLQPLILCKFLVDFCKETCYIGYIPALWKKFRLTRLSLCPKNNPAVCCPLMGDRSLFVFPAAVAAAGRASKFLPFMRKIAGNSFLPSSLFRLPLPFSAYPCYII